MTIDQPAGMAPVRTAELARIYRLLRAVAIVAGVGILVWQFSDVLTVIFASSLLAVILHGLSRTLSRFTHLPHWASVAVIVLLVIGLAVLFAWQEGPNLAEQFGQLKDVLNRQADAIRARLSQSGWGHIVLDQIPQFLGGNKQEGTGLPMNLAGRVAGTLTSAIGVLGSAGVVCITALYLALSPAVYVNGALRLVPRHHRMQAKSYAEAAGRAMWLWSIGQAVDMAAVTLLSWLGLWLLGVPLAFVLALIAGLCNFVPYIGAIVGAAPAVLIAFSNGPTSGSETIALFLAVQAFEGNVLAPVIQRRAVDLPPGVTILAQTIFGAIIGLPGLIFATPLTAVVMAVLQQTTPPLDDDQRIMTE